ncbi:hypothetical protein [Rossellomorea aquimaris]|uniref:hypothetical protein n=1 Tax=Rossellomorea aquimaris TaxID=189382 RepID=UPI0024948C89|nr:hypothetical protein [Rossellomorea aquimaris]
MIKKILLGVFVSCLILSTSTLVNANDQASGSSRGYYISTEDVLFSLISPKLDQIVKEQYGKQMIFNPLKVQEVNYVSKGTAEKGEESNYSGWIEIHMLVMVGDPSENPKIDGLVIKIDAPNIGTTKPTPPSNEIKDIEVDLVKYYKQD